MFSAITVYNAVEVCPFIQSHYRIHWVLVKQDGCRSEN